MCRPFTNDNDVLMIAGGCGRETPASLRKAPLSDRQEGSEAMRGVCLTQTGLMSLHSLFICE